VPSHSPDRLGLKQIRVVFDVPVMLIRGFLQGQHQIEFRGAGFHSQTIKLQASQPYRFLGRRMLQSQHHLKQGLMTNIADWL